MSSPKATRGHVWRTVQRVESRRRESRSVPSARMVAVTAYMGLMATPPPPEPAAGADALSPVELSVLELLPTDLTYREIADRLALPVDAVRAYGRQIRRRFDAVTRGEAVTAARRLELL